MHAPDECALTADGERRTIPTGRAVAIGDGALRADRSLKDDKRRALGQERVK